MGADRTDRWATVLPELRAEYPDIDWPDRLGDGPTMTPAELRAFMLDEMGYPAAWVDRLLD
jgi:hypothetical protein